MRTLIVAGLLGAVLASGVRGADCPDLLFPGSGKQYRLRLELDVNGQPPAVAWEAFLDRLFDYFDRDGDGILSPAEAARVFPLPVLGQPAVVVDFARLDTNRDGKGSRAEWKAFYRRAGFTPVVISLPVAGDRLRVSEILFRQLDRDGDGTLSKTELEQAPALLRRLDLDEDEVLTVAEILAAGTGIEVRVPERSPLELASAEGARPDATVTIRAGKPQQLGPLSWADGACALHVGELAKSTPVRATTEFYLALFRSAVGEKAALELKDLETDATYQVLVGLFSYADRNGDGKLTQAELEAFLALIELGAGCRVQVTVTTRGRDLFGLLDANGDGRLDLRELNRAAKVVAAGVKREGIFQQFQLDVDQSVDGKSFGPVALAGGGKRAHAAAEPVRRGPRWFQAMDRNGDGYLSPREFLGSPELFRLLDTDGDGLISVEEAETWKSP